MERNLSPEDARGVASSSADVVAKQAREFSEALRDPNLEQARRLVTDALTDGASPGRLYVDVVRPVLSKLELDGQDIRARLLAGLGSGLITDLVRALPISEGGGVGRAALLGCGELTIERLDGDVVAHFLEADGWTVLRHRGPEAALALGPASRADGIELAVAIVAGPEAALRLAPACTAMQRLPDPPVCLLCDFTGRPDWPGAATGLGADAFISDPEELLGQASRRLPAGETRRWGVSIARRGDALWLVPTGMLDEISARRLAEVVQSRIGTFSRVVVDLRHLAQISAAGAEGMLAWSEDGPLRDVPVQLVGDADVRMRLNALGTPLVLPFSDATAV